MGRGSVESPRKEGAARLATPAESLLEKISPARWMAARSVRKWLIAAGVEPESIDLDTLHAAADLDLALRGDRASLNDWLTVRDPAGKGEQHSPCPRCGNGCGSFHSSFGRCGQQHNAWGVSPEARERGTPTGR